MQFPAVHETGPVLREGQVTLTPVAQGASALGRILSYDAGPAGLAVQLTAELAPRATAQLDGQRVWVTADVYGTLVAFQAVARRVADTCLETDGITAPAEEHRRGHLRAVTRLSGRLGLGAAEHGRRTQLDVETVDLSRGGCRLRLAAPVGPDTAPSIGTAADVTIDLPERSVVASGDVLRVDVDRGEVVLRFTRVPAEDAGLIERHVLSVLL